MKTIASKTTETGERKGKRNGRRVYRHECMLECGHVEIREEYKGDAWIAPTRCKCSACGK